MLDKMRNTGVLRGGFGAGVGAAIAMMLVMAVLRFTTNTISLPELMEGSLISIASAIYIGRDTLESALITALGVGGKALLLTTIVEGTLLLGGLLGLAFTRLFLPFVAQYFNLATLRRWLLGVLYGLIVGLLLNAVFLPLVSQGFFGSAASEVTAPPDIARTLYGNSLAPIGLPVFLSMFVLSVVFGLVLVRLLPWQSVARTDAAVITTSGARTTTTTTATITTTTDGTEVGRRDFMKGLGSVGLAVLGGAALWGVIRRALEPPPNAVLQEVDLNATPVAGGGASATPTAVAGTSVNHASTPEATAPMAEAEATPPIPAGFEGVKPKLVPEITPVDSFYITTKNFVDPTVDGNAWQLNFSGLVDNPYTVNLKDVMAMPPISKAHTLACISNSVGGPLIGNGSWKGVDFGEMLRKAKPKAGATELIVRAADGYSDSFPLDIALNSGVVLAYEMNGQSLVQKHGYPTRLLVPNIFGMKNCKWITEVEVANYDYKGYWESQGWSDVAHYQTMSRIDYPGSDSIQAKPIYIGGVAFAGSRGVKRVEVTTDGGKTWADAQLRPSLGKDTWRQWIFPWLPKAGEYTVMVRATDGTGAVQTAQQQDTFPDGATGYDAKQVRVS